LSVHGFVSFRFRNHILLGTSPHPPGRTVDGVVFVCEESLHDLTQLAGRTCLSSELEVGAGSKNPTDMTIPQPSTPVDAAQRIVAPLHEHEPPSLDTNQVVEYVPS